MNPHILTDKNFLLYAKQHYDWAKCLDEQEFYDDLRRIKYIKKLITRYTETGNLKERLILNHLTVLGNVFPPEVLIRIIYLKMQPQMPYLKPFLLLMGVLPDRIHNIQEINTIDTDLISLDQGIVDRLRRI